MYYILAIISILPTITFFGYLFNGERRARLKENPLILIYFIITFGFYYVFWFETQILNDYIQMNFGAQVVVYGILSFAPLFHSDLPN